MTARTASTASTATFIPATWTFLDGLTADNTKAHFDAHRDV
jgi:hypothetical protein